MGIEKIAPKAFFWIAIGVVAMMVMIFFWMRLLWG